MEALAVGVSRLESLTFEPPKKKSKRVLHEKEVRRGGVVRKQIAKKSICNSRKVTRPKKSIQEQVNGGVLGLQNGAGDGPLSASASQSNSAESNTVNSDHTYCSNTHKENVNPNKVLLELEANSVVAKSLAYIAHGRYTLGFRTLFKASNAARRGLVKVIPQLVRNEVQAKVASSRTSCLEGDLNMERFKSFSWDRMLQEANVDLPILTAVLKGATTRKHCEQRLVRGKKKKESLLPLIGTILSLILFVRKPARYHSLQQVNSIMMWLCGCKRKLFSKMNHLGFCMGEDTARKCVEVLCEGFDDAAKQMKKHTEETIMIHQDMNHESDDLQQFQVTVPRRRKRRSNLTCTKDKMVDAEAKDGVNVNGRVQCEHGLPGAIQLDHQQTTDTTGTVDVQKVHHDSQHGSTLDARPIASTSAVNNTPEATSVVNNTPEATTAVNNTPEATSVVNNTPEATSAVNNTPEATSVVNNTPEATNSKSARSVGMLGALIGSNTRKRCLTRSIRRRTISQLTTAKPVNEKDYRHYTLIFDNINQKVTSRYQRFGNPGNDELNMVQAYMAKDRIPSLHLDDTPATADDIRAVPLAKLLPDEREINRKCNKAGNWGRGSVCDPGSGGMEHNRPEQQSC